MIVLILFMYASDFCFLQLSNFESHPDFSSRGHKNTGVELRRSGMASGPCTSSGTRRVGLVINAKNVNTTKQNIFMIICDVLKTFEVTTLTLLSATPRRKVGVGFLSNIHKMTGSWTSFPSY
jgi:hypothetical protein